MKKKGFVGLGTMGFPIAGHIMEGGYSLSVYNRTKQKAEDWVNKFGGVLGNSPSDVAKSADIVFVCVGNDEDVRSVVIGEDGILHTLSPGGIIIDHTTTSSDLAKELEKKCQAVGITFLDAPVSGGEIGAKSGKLTIMVGGNSQAFNDGKEVMKLYSKCCESMGTSGTGQLTKMVNQVCLAGLIQSLAEGLNFAEKAGLDSNKVVEVISQGAAQSWQMDNRSKTMLQDEYNYGFAVDLMIKDLSIALKEATKIDSLLEIAELVNNYYKEIQLMEGGRWDTSSLLKRLKSL